MTCLTDFGFFAKTNDMTKEFLFGGQKEMRELREKMCRCC
jgi:hypothetical protein